MDVATSVFLGTVVVEDDSGDTATAAAGSCGCIVSTGDVVFAVGVIDWILLAPSGLLSLSPNVDGMSGELERTTAVDVNQGSENLK